jgi:hypothetical protein
MRPKIFLVPVYIGSLKYLAKLWPRLSVDYEVEFLLVRGADRRRQQMENYARAQNLPYRILAEGLEESKKFRLPFLTSLSKRYRHIQACRQLFTTERPVKVVLTKTIAPHDVVVREAARAGAEIIILQWSFHSHDPIFIKETPAEPTWSKIYFTIMRGLFWLQDLLLVGRRYSAHWRLPNKIGVFDEAAAEGYAVSYRFPRERIKAVGNIDWQLINELQQRIKTSTSQREDLIAKYSLSPIKKKILLLVHGFHLRTWSGMNLAGQLGYYRHLLELIRQVVPLEQAEILIKLHPSDNPAFYESYQSLGVKVFGDEAASEELICLADLIISGTWTSVNYLVVASGKPAIFENLSPFKAKNAAMKYYHITQATETDILFLEQLRRWSAGRLASSSASEPVLLKALDNTLALIKRAR